MLFARSKIVASLTSFGSRSTFLSSSRMIGQQSWHKPCTSKSFGNRRRNGKVGLQTTTLQFSFLEGGRILSVGIAKSSCIPFSLCQIVHCRAGRFVSHCFVPGQRLKPAQDRHRRCKCLRHREFPHEGEVQLNQQEMDLTSRQAEDTIGHQAILQQWRLAVCALDLHRRKSRRIDCSGKMYVPACFLL